ncbi:MAG: hypothetical protein JW871_04065 [Endomicrobiales bacterium]|nr:hypothetical protein [Endomicrobiales bacterium]
MKEIKTHRLFYIFFSALISLTACAQNDASIDPLETEENFTIEANKITYDVIVNKPYQINERLPLIIYFTALKNKDSNISNYLSENGYVVWMPVLTSKEKGYPEDFLDKHGDILSLLLKKALSSPSIDSSNIDIISYSLDSCVVFNRIDGLREANKIALIGFGPPMDDMHVFSKVQGIINGKNYGNTSSSILLVTTESDELVDLGPVEFVRNKFVKAGKDVTAVQYRDKSHKDLFNDKEVLDNVIKFLNNEKPDNVVSKIKLNTKIIEKWNRFRKTGYW